MVFLVLVAKIQKNATATRLWVPEIHSYRIDRMHKHLPGRECKKLLTNISLFDPKAD
jgi:hypothetical protein